MNKSARKEEGDVMKAKKSPVEKLRAPGTIRSRAHRMLEMAEEGKLKHFDVDMFKMELVAGYVASVIRGNYPDLNIPYRIFFAIHPVWACACVQKHTYHNKINRTACSFLFFA